MQRAARGGLVVMQCAVRSLRCAALRCAALRCAALRLAALQTRRAGCDAMRCTRRAGCDAMRCAVVALRCVALRCVALRCAALRCAALRCAALRCAALRCAARSHVFDHGLEYKILYRVASNSKGCLGWVAGSRVEGLGEDVVSLI
jgi:hypothetical protein